MLICEEMKGRCRRGSFRRFAARWESWQLKPSVHEKCRRRRRRRWRWDSEVYRMYSLGNDLWMSKISKCFGG